MVVGVRSEADKKDNVPELDKFIMRVDDHQFCDDPEDHVSSRNVPKRFQVASLIILGIYKLDFRKRAGDKEEIRHYNTKACQDHREHQQRGRIAKVLVDDDG